MLPIFEMVAEEYAAQGLLERPVEFVVRAVEGLPHGTFRAVRDAFYELVDEDCLAIFGPYVSENTVPLREHVERTARGADPLDGRDREHARRVGVRPQQRLDARRAPHHGRHRDLRRMRHRGHRLRSLADRRGVPLLHARRVQGVRPAHHRRGGHTPGRAREAGRDGGARAPSGRTRSCTSASASASSA